MLLFYIYSIHVLLEYKALAYLLEFNDENLFSKAHTTYFGPANVYWKLRWETNSKERHSLVIFGGFFPASSYNQWEYDTKELLPVTEQIILKIVEDFENWK